MGMSGTKCRILTIGARTFSLMVIPFLLQGCLELSLRGTPLSLDNTTSVSSSPTPSIQSPTPAAPIDIAKIASDYRAHFLTTARSSHTASVLSNGKVLVVGGYDINGNPLSSAELYDPATGLFTVTGSLTDARYSHTASVLSNGKVLIVGGYGNAGNLSSAELYDPATGLFTVTGSLTDARSSHTASVLSNGKVLIDNGQGSGYGFWEVLSP
jgi:hypothetical protein